MKTLILTLVSMMAFASTSYSKELNLVCQTDELVDRVDMDVNVESQEDGSEKLSVVLMSMDGDTVRTYSNSSYKNFELTQALQAGKVEAAVEKTDSQNLSGEDFEKTGTVSITPNPKSQTYYVEFKSGVVVTNGDCFPR